MNQDGAENVLANVRQHVQGLDLGAVRVLLEARLLLAVNLTQQLRDIEAQPGLQGVEGML